MSDTRFRIILKCPICGGIIDVTLSRSRINKAGGIHRHIEIHEKRDPHLAVIDIDADGFIVSSNFISWDESLLLSLEELSRIETEKLAKILTWILLRGSFCIKEERDRLVRLVKRILPREVLMCADLRGSDKELIGNPPISYSVLEKRIREALSLKRFFIAYLRHVIIDYLQTLEKLEKLVSNEKSVVRIKQLKEELGKDIDELKFLLTILHYRGKIKARVDMIELKITELLR